MADDLVGHFEASAAPGDLVDLYHHTYPESAESIYRDRHFEPGTDEDRVYFTNLPSGGSGESDYGSGVVHLRMPRRLVNDWGPDAHGEHYYDADPDDIRPEHFVDPAPQPHEAAVRPGQDENGEWFYGEQPAHTADLPEEMHRGVGLWLPQEVHDVVHDASRPLHERAQALLGHMDAWSAGQARYGEGGLGIHWSVKPSSARGFATRYDTRNHKPMDFVRDARTTQVVFHARTAQPSQMLRSKRKLDEHEIFGINHGEGEIPLKKRSRVHLTGISWAPNGDKDAEMTRYDFPEPIRRTAGIHSAPEPGEELLFHFEAAHRPGRGEKTCACCHGEGSHPDGSECGPCDGSGMMHSNDPDVFCPGQPQPRRRHWREASMPRPDYDPSEELPTGRGVFYRMHLRDQPIDEAHARSRPVTNGPWATPLTPAEKAGQRGYSSFASPHHLSQYMDEHGWIGSAFSDWGKRDVVAFHGRQVGRGSDNEPLVVPEANPHCCGRVVHSRTSFNDFEDRIWGENAPESIPDKPWDNRRSLDPVQKSVDRHERRHWRQGSAEEEIRMEASDDTSYRMQHQGPDADDGEGMHEIGSGKVYPADIHQHPEWYGVGSETGSWDSWEKVRGSRGWPSRKVTMYRSLPSPHREVNTGDWVTSSAAYAREHGRMTNPDDDWPVVKFEARADQLRNAGDSINEWSYHGPKINRALVHFSGGKNHRGKGPRGGKADAALHEHEPPEMYEAYQAQTSEFRRKRKEERERKRSELESWANGQKEAAMDKHAISGETAPEGEDIFAEPTGRGPVHEHFDHLMEHPGESVRETPSGKEWVHPHLSAPDHGPYYVARKAEGDGFDSDSYQVLDRHGRTTGRSYGEGQMGGGRAFENAAHDWHRLTHRAEPPEDMPGYGEGSLWQTIKAHHEAKPPQFPHSRVDPRDAERVNRPEPRVHAPEGVSPSDEYHGSYEVVRHPDTGRYHVVDNAGRSAHVLPLNGHETQLQAERSRDYTEKRQQSKERARGIADAMYEGFHQIFDPGSTPESRESDRNLERGQDLMTRYEGGKGKVKFDSDEEGGAPYYEREHHLDDGRPSGWYVKHYGGTHADIYHRGTGDTGHDMMWLTRIQHPNGEESLSPAYGDEDLAADLKRWHDDPEGTRHYYENDKFGRQSEPGIHRWRQRHLGAAQAALVPEVIAHFASAEQTAAIAARSDPGYPNPLTGGHDWFHGTHSRPEDLNHGFDIRSWHDQGDEEARGHLSYWNNFIGPHFAAAHSLADHFARTGSSSESDEDEDYREPSSRYEERSPQATVHARLKLRNPKVYASEHDMDDEAYEHETGQGNWIAKHFEGYEDEDHAHPEWDPDEVPGDEEWPLAARFRHDDKQPLIGKDEAPVQGFFSVHQPGQRKRAQWLSSHPDKANIAARFRDRLAAQGHDGIIYGNELEREHFPAGRNGGACAIAFHPHQVEVTQHHETGRSCLPESEAEEQMRRMPSPDQDALPGAEEEADTFRGGFFRPRRASAAPDVIAHFAAAGPWMQQKLFHAQPDPTQHEPESRRHNPADPDQHLHWRAENDEDYEPDECEHCGGDLKAERRHAEQHQTWLENQDWHTDWTAEGLPDTLHRGIGVSLPDEVHQKVHDESLPVRERARALTDHLLAGGSGSSNLGNFWSAEPDVSKTYAESATRRYARHNDQTPVMFHVRTPEMEHIETDPDQLRHWGVYSYHLAGNREVPIQHQAPLHVTGISWAPPGHGRSIDSTPEHLHEDPAWIHHDLGEGGGIRAQATAEIVAHFDDERGERDDEWGFYHRPDKGWHCPVCQDFHDTPDEVNDHETGHTDWDDEYPRLPAEMHRGVALDDDGTHGRNLHYYRDPAHDGASAARDILHHLGDFGTHWTDDEEQARHYSGVGRGRGAEGHDMNVVVHARKPAREDIETDPWRLSEQGVLGRDYHEDREIPLKEGADVHVNGISWKYHDEPDSAWRRHDFGDGPQQRTAAVEYGPKPEFVAAPEHLSDDEKTAHWEGQRRIKDDWEGSTRRGLSMGHLNYDQARKLGYWGNGDELPDEGWDHDGNLKWRRGWQALPQHLYHVTTNLPAVRESGGLKTRRELEQHRSGGLGLGGGPDDTISLTGDHGTARNILRAMHEYHDVLNGRRSPHDMVEEARTGRGAQRPFLHDWGIFSGHATGSGEDELARPVRDVLEGRESYTYPTLRTRQDMHEQEGPGWEPEDEGRDFGGRHVHNGPWHRTPTPERRRQQLSEFYKNFAWARQHAGGHDNPLFVSNDVERFAHLDPGHFAIVHATPRPGAQGFPESSLGEWRTASGDAVQVHRAERLEGGHLKEAALIHGDDEGGYQDEPRHTLHPEAQCPNCGEPAFGEKGAKAVQFTLGGPEGAPEPVPSSVAQCNNCGEMYPAHQSGEQARADRELAEMNHANHVSERQGGDELFRRFTEHPTEPVIGWGGARELAEKWRREEQQFGGPGSVPLPQGHPMARQIREHRFNRVLHDPAASRPIELHNPNEDITRLSSTAAVPSDGEEMWGHLQEFHGVNGARTPGSGFMSDLHDRFHSGQVADPRRVPHQHDGPPGGQPARDPISRMFTPIPAEELEAQRRAREPKPERLDDREHSIRDVSRHYDWEGFDPHEISHLVHHPEQATFTREDVPVHTLRHVDEHGNLAPIPSYRDIAGQGDDERERLEGLERGYDNGEPVPPIVAVRDGEHHIIADGSHRAAVHAERGSTHIPAFVTQRTIYPDQHREAALAAHDDSLDWNEIADRHPALYGDPETHGDEASEDGNGIADAAAELYHDRPEKPYEETYGSLHPVYGGGDMRFYPRTVDPSRIDYARSEPGDPRVNRARRGYESQTPEQVPPVILVHRHGVFQVADGHHRSEGAAKARKPVRAYVAYSPHEDEPFSEGDRGPFHGAEAEERPAMRDQNGVLHRISYPGFPHTAEVPRPMTHEAALETGHCGGDNPHPPHDGWCRGTTFDEYNASEPGFCGNVQAHQYHGDCPGLEEDLPPRDDHGADEFSVDYSDRQGHGHDPVFGSAGRNHWDMTEDGMRLHLRNEHRIADPGEDPASAHWDEHSGDTQLHVHPDLEREFTIAANPSIPQGDSFIYTPGEGPIDPVFGARELVAHFEDRPAQIVYADVHDQVPALPAAPAGFWPGLQLPEDREGLLEALRELPALVGVLRDELFALARRLGDEAPLHPSVVDMIWDMAASCRTAREDMGRLGIASPEVSWEEPGPGPKA